MKRLLLLLALLPALAGAQPGTAKPKPAASGDPLLIEMELGPCFGFCPVYTLKVHRSGLVEYEGRQNVEQPGKKQIRLTRRERLQLKKKINAVDLWKYPDNIRSEVTDAQYVTLTGYKNGKSKTVRGSMDRPQPLLELEELLKKLVEKHGLKVREGVMPAKKG